MIGHPGKDANLIIEKMKARYSRYCLSVGQLGEEFMCLSRSHCI